MEKNRIMEAFLSLGLLVLAVLCVAVPFFVLFTGDGTYSWQFGDPATKKMMAEIALLFVLLSGILLLGKRPAVRWGKTALVCLIFCWGHVIFLPMTVSALYLGYVILAGRFVRTVLLGQKEIEDGWMADFILGVSAVLCAFCLLSAFKTGSIAQLRLFSAASGAALYLWAALSGGFGRAAAWLKDSARRDGFRKEGLQKAEFQKKEFQIEGFQGKNRTLWALLTAFIIVMILVQAGRMNISLDFDTLWYGVRSEYVLDNGTGIYENPGMVGMAYVYAKGLETLALPLSDLASHSYLLALNLWIAAAGLMGIYRLAGLFMNRTWALAAAALSSCIPGIMNMAISAKPDVITWVIQIFMVYYMACYIKNRKFALLALSGGAYLLSLTMKSTALVFSTAVFGMSGLYLLGRRLLSLRAPLRQWLLLAAPAGALTGIWARTMMITGMPVTSVFTSIFAVLGFQMKYPFATSGLPQNYEEASNLAVLLRRLFHMLLMPTGKDMGHVVFAWGSPLMLFLIGACLAAALLMAAAWKRRRAGESGGQPDRKQNRESAKKRLSLYAHVAFWPFLAVNLVSLVMLYQIDGNYFMLLYTGIIIGSLSLLNSLKQAGHRRFLRTVSWLLVPIMAFNVLMTAESNWAWSLGFSEIQWANKGRVNHEALQHEKMVQAGNEQIWNILAEDETTRVIAFGDHPGCLQFPCVVQSYKDITSPWGNVELVNTVEAFEEYMAYAQADYAYVEAGFIGEGNWEWSYGLVRRMIERGTLTDLVFEHGNVLARVDLDGVSSMETRENLRLFDENYITYERKQGGK